MLGGTLAAGGGTGRPVPLPPFADPFGVSADETFTGTSGDASEGALDAAFVDAFGAPLDVSSLMPLGIPSGVGPRPKTERPGWRGGGEDGVRPDESVKMPSLRDLLLEVLFQQDIQP
ncbi:hypothetical protein [Promicromonospora sp. NPDC057488]|uniref:hypothetical protein n=1 Tax=Promicromonospora sp. NPDC057488 TaxID=3346147 RepID=UPI00366E508E